MPHEEKKRRLKRLEEVQERRLTEINARLEGQLTQILVEGRRRGRWYGRNRNDKLVFFDDEANRKGEMVNIRIERTGPWSLQGAEA